MKFSGKWMQAETTILSEITQTQRDNIAHFLFYVDVSFYG